jgi:hypothetical protein
VWPSILGVCRRSANLGAERATTQALTIGIIEEGVKSGAETISRMQATTVFRVCLLCRKEHRPCWRESTNADVEVVVYDGGALVADLISLDGSDVMIWEG